MRVRYFPQRNDYMTISYGFGANIVTAHVNGESYVFDFSDLQEGEEADLSTSPLDPCPVLVARRVDGVLDVTLLRTIGPRPLPMNYVTADAYEAALETWRALWTDDLEVVIGD